MTMPVDLVLVRHGESEGNIASRMAREGDESAFTQEFIARHSSHWRLSTLGVEQARITGQWLHEQFPEGFDRWYVSEYERAKETAMKFAFEDAIWFTDYNLREREWGMFDTMPPSQREREYAHLVRSQGTESFFWTPPHGESLAQLTLRLKFVLDTLHRECENKRVIMVCHGEVMWAFRIMIERMSQERFRELDRLRSPEHRINNCQVIHYTRRADPDAPDSPVLNDVAFRRSVCPWDLEGSDMTWHPIVREAFTNKQLARQVEQWPHIVKEALH